jgi:hypothetical protein
MRSATLRPISPGTSRLLTASHNSNTVHAIFRYRTFYCDKITFCYL